MHRSASRLTRAFVCTLVCAPLLACASILGFEDFTDARDDASLPPDASEAGPLADATFDRDADAAPTAPDADAANDADATRDADTGATTECTPLATAPCTQDATGAEIPGLPNPARGTCKLGTKTCSATGRWGACTGAVGPASRDCESSGDNDCDGLPDNTIDAVCECNSAHPTRPITGGPKNCSCTETCGGNHKWAVCTPPNSCDCNAGETKTCTGASGCAGTQTCASDRTWGTCNGAPNKALYCQDHDGDSFCAATVACATVCPGQLAAEWKTNCATTDCDDANAAITPNAPPACVPTNACDKGTLTCAPSGSTCVDKGSDNGKVCAANTTCLNGACTACNTGFTRCGNACVNIAGTDANNCGGCGLDCGGGTCVAGLCQAKTVITTTDTIRSVAVLGGVIYFTTNSDLRRCSDASCTSVQTVMTGRSFPTARARNGQVYVLDDTTVTTYNASGTQTGSFAFPGSISDATNNHPQIFDVTPAGFGYYLMVPGLYRFGIQGSVATAPTTVLRNGNILVHDLEASSGDTVYACFHGVSGGAGGDTAVIATDGAFSIPTGLGRCDAVRSIGGNLVYTSYVSATSTTLRYCPTLSTCSSMDLGTNSIVADDQTNLYVWSGSSLVVISPTLAFRRTVVSQTAMASAASFTDGPPERMFTVDGSYVYFVQSDVKSIAKTRTF